MKTPFFDSLIDDFGIWQHTSGKRIFPSHGYALDDAARGLLACLALGKERESNVLFDYILKSRHKDGFYGFATADHKFFRLPSSDDAKGQVIWALGYAHSKNFRSAEALQAISELKGSIISMDHMRGHAYAILGAIYVDPDFAKKEYAKLQSFFNYVSPDWPWPESIMTYGNGMMAYAFLRYGKLMGDDNAAAFGIRLLTFIHEKCTTDRVLGPIGNDGWLPKDSEKVPDYSQQPIDTAYMIWAWVAAYEIYKNEDYLLKAQVWMDWFDGKNIKGEKMYDPKTLMCFDGIDKSGIHHNSGAESNICFVLSKYILDNKVTI